MSHASVADLLRSRADGQPDRLAYRYLADGEADANAIDYGGLYAHAAAIAATLRDAGAEGRPVLLCHAPGLSYVAAFFGCLLARAIAVPAPATGSHRNLARLQAIVQDAAPIALLTSDALLPRLTQWASRAPLLARPRWIVTDDVALAPRPIAPPTRGWPSPGPDDIAFLQYTSGSTDVPKGVSVSHRNVLENSALMARAFGYGAESHCFTWLPPYHDMGLIGGILQPLHGGFPCTMMSPVSFLQSPVRWLQGITRYGATISGGPNFAYELCARRIRPEQAATLDLRTWTVAFNGSELVRPDTVERFAAAFGPCGFARRAFLPCYGLAEATLFVSGGGPGIAVHTFDADALARHASVPAAADTPASRTRRLVSVGRADDRVLIVDPETRQEATGVGEIWVSGPSCAAGYWNRPDATADTFAASLADRPGPYLRTGDLGAIVDGELFITGRLKDLIIVRGLNYYPQAIEATVERTDPRLRPDGGAAFGVEIEDQERLVLVHEVDRHSADHHRVDQHGGDASLDVLLDAVRRAVTAEHDLTPYAVVLVAPSSVPKTSSGKVQRGVCRERFLAGTLPVLAEWRETRVTGFEPADAASADRSIDARITALVSAHTGLPIAQLDGDTPVASFGLDSLRATELLDAIEAETGARIDLASFLENPTLGELTLAVRDGMGDGADARRAGANGRTEGAEKAEEAEEANEGETPLTPGQESLLALHALTRQAGGPDIAIPVAFRLRGPLDLEAFRACWATLQARHPILRSVFVNGSTGTVQRLREDGPTAGAVPLELQDASTWSEDALSRALVDAAYSPFDLHGSGPCRIVIFRRAAAEHLVVISVHHIASDFWSLSILLDELRRLYPAARAGVPVELPPTRARFADRVSREREWLATPQAERAADYWRTRLANLPALDLPLDRPRPANRAFWGAAQTFTIGAHETTRLRAIAREHDATLYMVLLAAFQLLLSRCTGQETIAVSSPADGRGSVDFADVVGYFANPLILRGDLSADPTFRQWLVRTRATVLGALAHQAYPFPLVLTRLQAPPDMSRPPLAQALFLLHHAARRGAEDAVRLTLGAGGETSRLGDLVMESVALDRCLAQFDLGLVMTESAEDLSGTLEYPEALFDAETIRQLAGSLAHLLHGIAQDPDRPISRLEILSPTQRAVIVRNWNATRVNFGPHNTLHQLIEAQVERTPEATAVVFGERRLTYRQLNNHANQLAARLRRRGMGRDERVGVFIERSVELVVALLAILKAGGAYVPLDTEAPPDRTRMLIGDAGVNAVLVVEGSLASLAQPLEGALAVDVPATLDDEQCPDDGVPMTGANLAYVIYTSGSTGRPKGVMNTHEGICNRLLWMQQAYGLGVEDRVLQKTPYTFDVSVWEFFWPLMTGAGLVVAAPGAHRDPGALVRVVADEKVTTLHFVPSMLRAFLERPDLDRCQAVKRVICSGEALPFDLQRQFFTRFGAELHNLYGPTEAAVDVTSWACDRNDESGRVPIGRPIANTEVYVLDQRMEPVAPGVAGMTYLGGVGLARGYLREPALTAEKFVPDPLSGRPGARLFRTGDLARQLRNGALEYIGRTDHQVKIRGARVELGEIEAVLLGHPRVREAAVIDWRDRGEVVLVAYVAGDAAELPSVEVLRPWLRSQVPEYMMPARFVFLDRLPVTANGKLDRKALATRGAAAPSGDAPFVAPRTELEERVAELWMTVLGLSSVGVHDNFFVRGGHSLALMQVSSRIRETFDVDVPIRVLLDVPTVAGMALAITSQRLEGESQDEVARLLAEIGAPQGSFGSSDIR